MTTVQERGWAGKQNGELLTVAQAAFDVFITVDRSLYFQQNLPKFNIAVLVLFAKSNRIDDLRSLAPRVLEVLSKLKPGNLEIIQ